MDRAQHKKVIFHYLPPSHIYHPSAAFSILKSFLQSRGYVVGVKYWNVILDNILSCNAPKIEQNGINIPIHTLFPFLYKISVSENDKLSRDNIIANFMINQPDAAIEGPDYDELVQMQLDLIAQQVDDQQYGSEVLMHGFTSKFDQWIAASFFAEQIKMKSPDVPIVIGGFQSKETAMAVMKKVPFFDFAIWGEGEYSLLELCEQIKQQSKDCESIPRLIYRSKDGLLESKTKKSQILDLGSICPDFDDYFNVAEQYKLDRDQIFLTIEDSRGCCWGKCKFCGRNISYNYREKSNPEIIAEIKAFSSRCGIYNFMFTGANLRHSANKKLESLLDMIVDLRKEEDNEYNFVGELIPFNISSKIMKKIASSALTLQVGYESISDSILEKLKKQSRFIDLLFFLKYAHKYGVRIIGANILANILDETEEDVIEAINNLPFLRFFLGEHSFEHNYSDLFIDSKTWFYKELSKAEEEYWSVNQISPMLPENFFKGINRFDLFYYKTAYRKNDSLWDKFQKLSEHYTNTKYYYKILKEDDGSFFYNEFCNDSLVKSIFFNELEYVSVLEETTEITTIDRLFKTVNKKHPDVKKEKLLQIINDLEQDYLLFFDKKQAKVLNLLFL